MTMQRRLFYAVAFQVGWFVCIMGGNKLSLGYAIIFLSIHLWLQGKSQPYKEIAWIALVLCCGLLIETLFLSAGFLYETTPPSFFEKLHYPPPWLLSLWLLFAIALRNCFAFLLSYPRLGYLMCITMVPANYVAGSKLNQELQVNQPFVLTLPLIALVWVVFLGCLIYIKRHYFEDIFDA